MENVSKQTETYREAVEKTLTDEQMEFLRSYIDCAQEYADLTAEEAFCDGFRLASRLMAEALRDDGPTSIEPRL